MNYLGFIKISTVALLVGIVGCRSSRQVVANTGRPMPGAFASVADTGNSVTVNWKEFFNDKYLAQLADSALANNWDAKIALQRIEVVRADVLLNKGAMVPAVRAIAAGGMNKYGAYTMDGAGNMTTPIYDGRIIPDDLPKYVVGLQAAWEVDVWGRLKNRKKASLARFLASVEGKNVVLTNLIAEVAGGYYELLSLDAQLAIVNETITLQENALEIVKVQKEVAVVNELAVEQFEAQLIGLRSMKLEIEMQINEQENKINILAGRNPQSIPRDKRGLADMLPTKVKTGIPIALLQNRPDIRLAEAELVATKADIRAARAAFYPSLSITAGVGFEAFKTSLLFTTPQSLAYNFLGGLAAPLINRSALKAELRRANASQQEALLNYRKTIAKGYNEVYTEMQRIDNLEKIYDLRAKQVATLTKSIETSSELFKMGRSSYLEVLITQQNALQSKLERVTTRKKQFQSTVNIYKALGGGWR